MQLGLIGLGKMGANMNVRLLRGGHEMIVWNRSEAPRIAAAEAGVGLALAVSIYKKFHEVNIRFFEQLRG